MIHFLPSPDVPRESVDGACHETGPSTTFSLILPTMTAFYEKPQAFYLRFSFVLFAAVEGSGLNVVDGPVSWRVGRVDSSRGENDPFCSVPQGIGWG